MATSVIKIGVPGPKGKDGSGMNWRGNYDSNMAYVKGDIVRDGKAVFLCNASNTGMATSETSFWSKLVEDGENGADGENGQNGTPGAIGINWRGNYDNSAEYAVRDAVFSGGSSFICIAATTGNAPTDTSKWSPLALKGEDAEMVDAVISRADSVTGAARINEIVSMSQEDYDALATPDANTLYFITE